MRKNLLLMGTLLGVFVFLSGCGEDKKKEDKEVVRPSILIPSTPPPVKGIIGTVPLTTGDPQVPRGLSFINGEDALIVTAEGPFKSDKGTIYMAPKRDLSFSIRTVRRATIALNFAKFRGHVYNTETNTLFVCGNHKDPTTPPQVLVLTRQNDGRFFLVHTIGLDSTQQGMTCGHLALVGDYLFATNQTPKALTDDAVFYAKVSGVVPTEMEPILTYGDLPFKLRQIGGLPISDIKPKVTQAPDKFSIWLLLSDPKNIVGVDFISDGAGGLERDGNVMVLNPGDSLRRLQSFVPYTDEFFLILDNSKLYSSRFDATGKLVETKVLLDNLLSKSVLSMYLGKDRLRATSLPVVFYLPSPLDSVSLVTEFAFDPDA
ncbi:hypothetical protein [Candidatus Ichthyocystis hellenicum]|uniref:hypothetical protein n=1 Tax=Candidatus Ichthyocystis hellenicum TaxID=1561003 RepID=UPI000B88BDA6|nr:hypothetical protein [Candidatus Ichthyocystis hellenicum]